MQREPSSSSCQQHLSKPRHPNKTSLFLTRVLFYSYYTQKRRNGYKNNPRMAQGHINIQTFKHWEANPTGGGCCRDGMVCSWQNKEKHKRWIFLCALCVLLHIYNVIRISPAASPAVSALGHIWIPIDLSSMDLKLWCDMDLRLQGNWKILPPHWSSRSDQLWNRLQCPWQDSIRLVTCVVALYLCVPSIKSEFSTDARSRKPTCPHTAWMSSSTVSPEGEQLAARPWELIRYTKYISGCY